MSLQTQFWEWFQAHEVEVFDFEADPEAIFDKIGFQLKQINPNLTFEIGPVINGQRQFVISAGGIKQAFPAVQELVAMAPGFERWIITAFRPRRKTLNIIEIGGKSVSPNDVKFTLLNKGKEIGIRLFVPGYSEDSAELKQIAYLMLDEALGEFDVESKLGMIKMLSPDIVTPGDRYHLNELADKFDKLSVSLNK